MCRGVKSCKRQRAVRERSTGKVAAKDVKEGRTRLQTQVPKSRYCGTVASPVNGVIQTREEKRGLRPKTKPNDNRELEVVQPRICRLQFCYMNAPNTRHPRRVDAYYTDDSAVSTSMLLWWRRGTTPVCRRVRKTREPPVLTPPLRHGTELCWWLKDVGYAANRGVIGVPTPDGAKVIAPLVGRASTTPQIHLQQRLRIIQSRQC
jgi:hypothetical protein